MNYTQLSELQLECSVLASAIIARNAKLGWADKKHMEQEDEYVMKLIISLKENIDKIEKGLEK